MSCFVRTAARGTLLASTSGLRTGSTPDRGINKYTQMDAQATQGGETSLQYSPRQAADPRGRVAVALAWGSRRRWGEGSCYCARSSSCSSAWRVSWTSRRRGAEEAGVVAASAAAPPGPEQATAVARAASAAAPAPGRRASGPLCWLRRPCSCRLVSRCVYSERLRSRPQWGVHSFVLFAAYEMVAVLRYMVGQ